MRDQEVQGKILTVHELFHHVPASRCHDHIAVVLVVEGGPREDHAELTAIVSVVVPAVVLHIPGSEMSMVRS